MYTEDELSAKGAAFIDVCDQIIEILTSSSQWKAFPAGPLYD